MPSLGALAFFILAFFLSPNGHAEEKANNYEPSPYQLRDLEKKGVSLEKWRFCEAIWRHDLAQVKKSLDEGADANGMCDGAWSEKPPLFYAVTNARAKPEIILALVKKGANVNARLAPARSKGNSQGLTPMQQMNLSMMATMQQTGQFPLYYAAQHTNPEVVELLIKLGADVSLKTSHGNTALFPVTEIEIAKVLLKHGANINEKDALGRTVLSSFKQDSLVHLREGHHLRSKYEAYAAWLVSRGAHE